MFAKCLENWAKRCLPSASTPSGRPPTSTIASKMGKLPYPAPSEKKMVIKLCYPKKLLEFFQILMKLINKLCIRPPWFYFLSLKLCSAVLKMIALIWIINWLYGIIFYASPTSGEAYRDRRLTTNFELWVEIFCVPTCFHKRIPKPCLSVCLSVCLSICPYPEKRNHHSFVNISPTLVIDTSMERSSRVLRHGNPKIGFFSSKKFEIRILTFDEKLKSP